MIPKIVSVILTVYAVVYYLLTLIVSFGAWRLSRRRFADRQYPKASVVLCARNEEETIRMCLESLAALDYPEGKLEAILVDDESEDDTRRIFEEYQSRYSIFKVLSTEGVPRDLPAKQRPLNYGIEHASGEIILITDADCTFRPGWVKSHAAAYSGNVGMAGGVTTIDPLYTGIYAGIQRSELVSKLAVSMGAAGVDFPITMMGNNLSFKNDAYTQTGGLKNIEPNIVEDMALMNAVVERTPYKISWASGHDSVVYTRPEKTFMGLIHQRSRWLTELPKFSLNGKLLLLAEIMMGAALVTSLVLLPFGIFKFLWLLVGGLWMLGYSAMFIAAPGTGIMDIVYMPLSIIFQFVYGFTIIGRFILGKRDIVWRGRVFDGSPAKTDVSQEDSTDSRK